MTNGSIRLPRSPALLTTSEASSGLISEGGVQGPQLTYLVRRVSVTRVGEIWTIDGRLAVDSESRQQHAASNDAPLPFSLRFGWGDSLPNPIIV